MPRSAKPATLSEPIFISAKETARILDLSINNVYELLDRQAIESRYQGRRRLVVRASVESYALSLPTERV